MTLCCNTRTYIPATSKSEPSVEDSGTDFSQVAYTTPGTKLLFRDYNNNLYEYECDPSSYGKCETTNTGRTMVRMTALDLAVRCTNKSPVNKMLEPQGKIQLSMESGSIELQDINKKLSCDSKQRGDQDSSKGVQLTKEKENTEETAGKNEDSFIALMCMTTSCEKNTSSGYKRTCEHDNRKYIFQTNNHVTDAPQGQKTLSDGSIQTNLDFADITTDSEFYFYSKNQTSGGKVFIRINNQTTVAKISIDRLTGAYNRVDSTKTVFNDGTEDWETEELKGSCIPVDSIKDRRKF